MSSENPIPPTPPGPVALALPVIRPLPARTLVAGMSVILLLAAVFSYLVEVPRREYLSGRLEPVGGEIKVLALRAGTVVSLAAAGSDLNPGESVALVAEPGSTAPSPARGAASAPRQDILAPLGVTVLSTAATRGSSVLAGQLLSTLAVRDAPLQAVLHVPSRALAHLQAGQLVQLRLAAYPYETYGPVQAVVERLELSPLAAGEVDPVVPQAGHDTFYKATAQLMLVPDQTNDGTPVKLQSGMRFDASVEVERRTLLAWVMAPLLKQFN